MSILSNMSKRAKQILELLTEAEANRLEVTTLASRLGVSPVTARKDLDELEQQGLIVREHGYALLRSPDDIRGRMAYHFEVKKRIAERAAQLVANGDTLLMESGSCCALFADVLTHQKRDLTILTNSVFIAQYIRGKANFQIILLGGIYQQEAQVLVGPLVQQTVQNFCVNQLFLGIDGYSHRTGFTNRDQMRAQAVHAMAQQAERIVILTESEKLRHHGIVPLDINQHPRTVITDAGLSPAIRSELEQQGVSVIAV